VIRLYLVGIILTTKPSANRGKSDTKLTGELLKRYFLFQTIKFQLSYDICVLLWTILHILHFISIRQKSQEILSDEFTIEGMNRRIKGAAEITVGD
jgi:hypothetical protein